MAVKNTKPYSTPKRTTKKTKTEKKKNNNIEKDLDVTTRIRVDEVRINDVDSLDTSFLEGRNEKRVKKNTRKVKTKILNDNGKKVDVINIIKIILYLGFSIAIILLFAMFIRNNMSKINNNKGNNEAVEIKKKDDKPKVVVDRNYLFVGDFYTDNFNFEDFDLDYHYVKSSDKELTSNMLLSDLENMIYIYNPSKVFINIGYNDLNNGKKMDDIINDLEEIVSSIKNNRSYADIYIQSLYPINTDAKEFDNELVNKIDNDIILKYNKRILAFTKSNKINYLDVYSMLEKNNELDLDYTDDGVNLNEEGYKQVLKVINKVID